jgi:Tol biopolymer transport system component
MDVFDLQWVADPQISPDGRNIAYVRMGMDIKTDRPRGTIWLMAADGGHPRPLSGADSSSHPRWSPDGSRIAYLANGSDGSTQLFVYWVDSGVTAPITRLVESPSAPAWSADGHWLAFTMAVPAEHKPLKVDLPDAPKGAKWADPPKLIDRMVFRVDGEGYLPNTYSQLFVVSADGGSARQLTHGDFDIEGTPVFMPDGRAVLIAENRRTDADFAPLDSEIYRVDLADDSLHALTDRRGPDQSPAVSPDGKHIAYIGFDDKHLGHQPAQLYVMDSDGTHAHSLTPTLDRDVSAPRWARDGKQLVFQYEERGAGIIGIIDLAGKIRILASDLGGGDVTRPYTGGSFSVASTGRFAYTRAATTAPAALATGTSTGDIVTLASLSDALLQQRSMGAVEEINFKSSADARTIQGWVIKPPAFDSAKKVSPAAGDPRRPVRQLRPQFCRGAATLCGGGICGAVLEPPRQHRLRPGFYGSNSSQLSRQGFRRSDVRRGRGDRARVHRSRSFVRDRWQRRRSTHRLDRRTHGSLSRRRRRKARHQLGKLRADGGYDELFLQLLVRRVSLGPCRGVLEALAPGLCGQCAHTHDVDDGGGGLPHPVHGS